ncbi:MAG: pantoate--beta-alanine ligase [Alphaproteobacteria bacterium]|nr:pantoate--beta-alanine ligase [Alphaproteobacteria bacterium]
MTKTKVFKKITDVRDFVDSCKTRNQKIGFVPTMGALHDGHLSLISEAQKVSDIVIVSIFVNKAQFNDLGDYQKYPRHFDNDINKLENIAVNAIFIPHEDEIYPADCSFKIIPVSFIDCLCAKSRVGHFDGVALVVTKLFNIVRPHQAFFGEKDFQQLLIIKKLVVDLNFDIKIFGLPTYREVSGLAMSSRNQRLSLEGLKKASMIYKTLNEIKSDPDSIDFQKTQLIKNGFEIDYLEIRNEHNLELDNDAKSSNSYRIFIAVYLEGIRLIDNLKL